MEDALNNKEDSLFPNLFVESIQPTVASISIFAFADLRRVAREKADLVSGSLNDVLELPISGPEMIQVCTENKKLLDFAVSCKADYLMGEILEQYADEVTSVDHVMIHHCGDDNPYDECVYCIITNSETKQITLSFRGSTTMKDWMTDAKLVHGDIANPLYDPNDEENDQPDFLSVHIGFRDYLYDVKDTLLPSISLERIQSKVKTGVSNAAAHIGDALPDKDDTSNKVNVSEEDLSSSKEASLEGTRDSSNRVEASEKDTLLPNKEDTFDEEALPKRNKIDVILDQVQALMDANPGYKLYIVGHSLGGALAMLTSVSMAIRFATPEIPVTCIAIANPRVGDNLFRGAIQSLEKQKKLRCLSIHNYLDMIPSMPSRMCRCDFCRPNNFCLAGMQLILTKHGFTIVYHSERNDSKWKEFKSEVWRLLIIVCCCFQMGVQHTYRRYLNRLVAQKDKLRKLYLNDLYKKEGIIYDC